MSKRTYDFWLCSNYWPIEPKLYKHDLKLSTKTFLYVSLSFLSHLIAAGGNAECLINMNLGKFVKYFPFIIPAILQFVLVDNYN
jgi:hypothetical protein